jgi:lactoylglutathione lyase
MIVPRARNPPVDLTLRSYGLRVLAHEEALVTTDSFRCWRAEQPRRLTLALCTILLAGLSAVACAPEAPEPVPAKPATDAGARPSDASADAAKDAAKSAMGDAAVVAPAITPYVAAAGIGVTDLEASAKFYTEVLGLTFKYDLSTPDWDEKVFEDVRGNSVVLMKFKRERNTKHNPVKLVFAVKDTQEAYDAVLAGGGTSFAAPTTFGEATVALTYDPDEYLVELYQAPTVPSNVLVGMGIGVSSLDESADFYTRVLGLRFERDIPVPNFMDEKELKSYLMKGPSVVLMHYQDESIEYKDIPAKVVLGVSDAKGLAKAITDEDSAKLLAPPAPYPGSGLIVGMAKDLEGYLVEIIEADPNADAGAAGDAGARVDAGASDAGAKKDAGTDASK